MTLLTRWFTGGFWFPGLDDEAIWEPDEDDYTPPASRTPERPPATDVAPKPLKASVWSQHCPTAKPWTKDDPHGVCE